MTDALSTAQVFAAARVAWSQHLGGPPDDGLRDRLAAGSIAAAAHTTALTVPSHPAIEIDGTSLTHGELDECAARMAGWLRRGRVAPRDVVLVSSPTSVGLVVAYLGALRAGASVVLVNPTYTEAELDYLLRDSGAVVALAAGPGLPRLRKAGQAGGIEVVDLEALVPGGDPLSGRELSGAPPLEPADADPERPAILAYTSGTTGRPKSVPLTDANVLASTRAVMLAWRWQPEDVLVHALPLFHQHGLGGLHATLLAGSRAVIHSSFDPGRLCDSVPAVRASVLFAVPAMYARLAEWDRIGGVALDSLRLLVSGSAPLSPSLAERVAELAGQMPLERYGTTESGLDVSNPYLGPRRPGSVGLALPGIEVALADDDGRPVADGQDGEIAVRGPQVFSGYRGDRSASADAFHPGGWFRTGDIGRIDADGYLSITGRTRELIISGGMNVYPREVEFALEAHHAVTRAAVVGVPSERWGEEVVAAVVPAAGTPEHLDPSELLDFARARLAPYKCPKRVIVVDELPANAMGKVRAGDVRQLFEEG